jgi:hypothetical protein
MPIAYISITLFVINFIVKMLRKNVNFTFAIDCFVAIARGTFEL